MKQVKKKLMSRLLEEVAAEEKELQDFLEEVEKAKNKETEDRRKKQAQTRLPS